MASSLLFIVVVCLTGGLWTGANADCELDDYCDTCKTCPSGWTQFKDHCYLYQAAPLDWADAEVACIALGGNLASVPNDKSIYDFIRTMILSASNKNSQTWVGGHDAAKEGTWLWSDGSKFDFNLEDWKPSNYLGREHCMELNYNDKPNDMACTNKRPYVCGKHL